jgi:hypothetical protein
MQGALVTGGVGAGASLCLILVCKPLSSDCDKRGGDSGRAPPHPCALHLSAPPRLCCCCHGQLCCAAARASTCTASFSPLQLWLLAEWVCSEGGRPVRKPLAAELVRLVDALITSTVRWAGFHVGR